MKTVRLPPSGSHYNSVRLAAAEGPWLRESGTQVLFFHQCAYFRIAGLRGEIKCQRITRKVGLGNTFA